MIHNIQLPSHCTVSSCTIFIQQNNLHHQQIINLFFVKGHGLQLANILFFTNMHTDVSAEQPLSSNTPMWQTLSLGMQHKYTLIIITLCIQDHGAGMHGH